ncbi:hypothetical protein PoB_001652800 [Plakobranchus ocellatus]|uniref:Uncharacterized protein n=1 Tax=Plakobranchus ocellatus TaxID=259542 RepID=A0AAV3Z6D7_9GAST|nr:hypothetical protein PoB_001652800 [Plakobranchus ocellatus]
MGIAYRRVAGELAPYKVQSLQNDSGNSWSDCQKLGYREVGGTAPSYKKTRIGEVDSRSNERVIEQRQQQQRQQRQQRQQQQQQQQQQ